MAKREYTAMDVIKRMSEDEVFRIELLLLIENLLYMLKHRTESN